FVSVLRDATERKKIERAKTEAVSVVSHEMRTPLTSIKGSLRLLHSGTLGIFDNNAKQALDIAVRNTEQLLLLVDDILDLEKIRAGKMKMDKAPVDLVALVDEVVEMNRGYGDELRVNFQFETDLTDAIASVSAARFTQVLANLLSNAAKFTPAGETVQVMLDSENGFWKISVTDKGPGIPEEAYHMVFASFAQLRSPDGKERKGTGLGLAIAQRIVHAHDGEIDFVSKCGEGTTFFVKLPMHTIQPQQLDHAFKIESTLDNLNNPEKILLDDAKPLEI
ncbi:His Kinase A (phospho-acceptor) domain-containing protein, partial [Roseovarius tolerans]